MEVLSDSLACLGGVTEWWAGSWAFSNQVARVLCGMPRLLGPRRHLHSPPGPALHSGTSVHGTHNRGVSEILPAPRKGQPEAYTAALHACRAVGVGDSLSYSPMSLWSFLGTG